MDISVALCTFNGAHYVEQQLQSIAAQTLPPVEVVICDDGSTDDTLPIVERFRQSAPFPVHVHRNPVNLGSTRNFEQCMQRCVGDFLALCDQDDEWLPTKLATMAAVFGDHPESGGAFSNASLMDAAGTPVAGDLWVRAGFSARLQASFAEGRGAGVLIERDLVTGCTMLFRRSFLAQVLPIPPCWIHDGWIALVLASVGTLRPVPDRTMRYRLHEGQQVGLPQVRVGPTPAEPESRGANHARRHCNAL